MRIHTSLIVACLLVVPAGAQSRNIKLDAPDLIAMVESTRGGLQEIHAYGDTSNPMPGSGEPARASSFRFFTPGYLRPVQVDGRSCRVDRADRMVVLHVQMLADTQRDALAARAQAKYGTWVEGEFTRDNIFLVPLEFFEARIVLAGIDGSGERIFTGTTPDTGETVLQVQFEVEGPDELERLARAIDEEGVQVRYQYAFVGQEVKTSRLEISAAELERLDIARELVGDGSARYVTRRQLARLSGIVYRALDIREDYQMDEERFSEAFTEALVNQVLATRIERVDFRQAVEALGQSTGWPQALRDLKADEIVEAAGKVLEVDESSDKEHDVASRESTDEGDRSEKASGQVETGVKILAIFGGDMDVQFAREKSDEWKRGEKSLDDRLREINRNSKSDIEWTLKGRSIVPKSVALASLTQADFGQALRVNRVRIRRVSTEGGGKGSFDTIDDLVASSIAGGFVSGRLEDHDAALAHLAGRIEQLESEKEQLLAQIERGRQRDEEIDGRLTGQVERLDAFGPAVTGRIDHLGSRTDTLEGRLDVTSETLGRTAALAGRNRDRVWDVADMLTRAALNGNGDRVTDGLRAQFRDLVTFWGGK